MSYESRCLDEEKLEIGARRSGSPEKSVTVKRGRRKRGKGRGTGRRGKKMK